AWGPSRGVGREGEALLRYHKGGAPVNTSGRQLTKRPGHTRDDAASDRCPVPSAGDAGSGVDQAGI
ncbi:MAG: hypothetical protein LC769_07610, partial [Chloroflexi bacterium]|nr:hypothetical protein [Chloroflexota bacterium]